MNSICAPKGKLLSQLRLILLLISCISVMTPLCAVNYTSNVASGNWSASASWTPAGVPGAGDNVTIAAGQTITMDLGTGSCTNLSVSGTLFFPATVSTLNATGTLQLNNGGTINGNSASTLNVTGAFTGAAGTATLARVILNVSGGATFNGTINITSTGTKTFGGGAFCNPGSGFFYTATVIVAFPGGLTTSGAVSLNGAGAVNGNFTAGTAINIGAGSVVTVGPLFMTVTGTTTVNGSINFVNNGGTKNFASILVNAGGNWNSGAVDEQFILSGNLTVNGAFSSSLTLVGPSEYRFTSATATFTGSATIAKISVGTGGILTNTGILTCTDSLWGGGTYLQAPGSVLNWNNPNKIAVGTFNPSAGINTVDYLYAGNQRIRSATYSNLSCSASGNKIIDLGNITVSNDLLIQNTAALDADAAFNRSITLGGNWTVTSTNPDPFVEVQGTVTLNGGAMQTINTVLGAGETFYNLTLNNSASTLMNTARVTNVLNMTAGKMNLNNFTLTLGTSTASTGSLSYTSGWLYGGTFTRWVNATGFALGAVSGMLPLGSTTELQPLWVGLPALSSGGTISLAHSSTSPGHAPVLFNDPTWTGGTLVTGASLATWELSTGNGLNYAGTGGSVRFGGSSFTPFVLADLNACLASSVTGTFQAAISGLVPLLVNRVGLTLSDLTNIWHIGTRDINQSPLPIELISFSAIEDETAVVLQWTTATEIDNDYFTVERSRDGTHFDAIARISGAGNSVNQQFYTCTDATPYAGVSYYRLRQTDYNGQSTVSAIIPVEFDSPAEQLVVYPNPARPGETLICSGNETDAAYQMEILNADGRIVQSRTGFTDSDGRISVEHFDVPPGVYYIRITTASGVCHQQFIEK